WVRSGWRATFTSDLNSGRPGSTAMSELVPPVSKVMRLSMPFTSARWRPPITPATGPDMTVWIGVRASIPALAAPPSEFIIRARAREAPQRKLLQRAQVARDRRADIGVGHGRSRALVLAPFRIDLVRQRHVEIGCDGANDFSGRFLVDGIGVSEQEAYGDGLDAIGHERRDRGAHVVRHQRLDHLALEAHPLADLENSVAREQHSRRGREDVEDVLAAPLPSDLVDVAETARGQQSDPNALAFEQGVERGG